ncbi:MAG: hypothetical protein HOE80_03225 [Candidatus Magasanikbacteria bacterium]|jgi:hypothetical protein|nr:hypothetical protein [Candidatus Magasanikbacteria bacterium]MBT4071709.1 hypothetical protein [Candidatus Magasanikbacteria bacterium]
MAGCKCSEPQGFTTEAEENPTPVVLPAEPPNSEITVRWTYRTSLGYSLPILEDDTISEYPENTLEIGGGIFNPPKYKIQIQCDGEQFTSQEMTIELEQYVFTPKNSKHSCSVIIEGTRTGDDYNSGMSFITPKYTGKRTINDTNGDGTWDEQDDPKKTIDFHVYGVLEVQYPRTYEWKKIETFQVRESQYSNGTPYTRVYWSL